MREEFIRQHQPYVTNSNQRKSKLTEEFAPSAELLNHPLSESFDHPPEVSNYSHSTPSLTQPLPSNTSSTMQSLNSEETAQAQSWKESIDERISQPSGAYALAEDMGSYNVSQFCSPIAGYFTPNYAIEGPKFHDDIQQDGNQMVQIKARWDDLWLSTQLFWDLMLRMQPNCIISNPEYTKQAVNFMLDVVIGRMLPYVRPSYDARIAGMQLQLFNRCLRRLELLLRNDMVTCGNSPKVLCGCMVAVKRPKHKVNIWTRLFGSKSGDQQGRSEDRSFRLRDIAGLIRLEDYLTHVSIEFQHQVGPSSPEALSGLIHTAIGFMDDEIKRCLPKKEYPTADELKAEWIYLLCHPDIRAGVCREVKAIVHESMAFQKKHGKSGHREECELWTGPKAGLAKMLSFPVDSNKDKGTSPLHPSFWKKDPKGPGK
ncbi:hypothetical protein FSARC_3863 [Fusarium sarcochroum]|uniref:Uncharacterized protein n=1 Tax=Fusarium sarcochroum TaxID=1208366 RepID=A0A8H4U378_9HYPO|nr:hypothetical protein FSARC_3863 [Fusarium sarcochroum]